MLEKEWHSSLISLVHTPSLFAGRVTNFSRRSCLGDLHVLEISPLALNNARSALSIMVNITMLTSLIFRADSFVLFIPKKKKKKKK